MDTIHLLENLVLDDRGYKMYTKEINIKNIVCNYYFDILMKAKKLDTKNIVIDQKNYKDFTVYFTRYDSRKSIVESLYYHELMGKIEGKCEGKIHLMLNDNILKKVLNKINRY